MLVTKIGDDLAVRLPQDVVEALGLKEGDAVELKPTVDGSLEIKHSTPTGPVKDLNERWAIIKELRALRGSLPAGFKFDREEANER